MEKFIQADPKTNLSAANVFNQHCFSSMKNKANWGLYEIEFQKDCHNHLLSCLLLFLVAQDSIAAVGRLQGILRTRSKPRRFSPEKHGRSPTVLIVCSTTLSGNARKRKVWLSLPPRQTKNRFGFSTQNGICRCCVAASRLCSIDQSNRWPLDIKLDLKISMAWKKC